MKSLMTALVLSLAAFSAQAGSFGPTMDTLTRDLSFPAPTTQTVTKDKTPSGN
ncbi:hypothetical protein [Ruegeria sp. ANG-S4]|uniref:hypothetical protein n=1 Tax=Ruegeria sp. ANG-S4 TaxID=1577904 RepID=UPI000A84FA37|nr:hypothetical protein [Ruegeria sp. ANG-S4]